MVSLFVAQVLSFIFTTFLVVLLLNMLHEGDYTQFVWVLLASLIMLFIYPLAQSISATVAQFVNSFIAWTALIKITSEGVTFLHAAITAIVATIFVNLLLPPLLSLL